MLFYVALFIASVFVSFIILWVYRLIVASTDRISTYHLPNTTQNQAIRNGVRTYSTANKTASARRHKKPLSKSPAMARHNRGQKTDWGWKPNVGYPVHNQLSGQAYKPSEQAVSTFALKNRED